MHQYRSKNIKTVPLVGIIDKKAKNYLSKIKTHLENLLNFISEAENEIQAHLEKAGQTEEARNFRKFSASFKPIW